MKLKFQQIKALDKVNDIFEAALCGIKFVRLCLWGYVYGIMFVGLC